MKKGHRQSVEVAARPDAEKQRKILRQSAAVQGSKGQFFQVSPSRAGARRDTKAEEVLVSAVIPGNFLRSRSRTGPHRATEVEEVQALAVIRRYFLRSIGCSR